MALFAVKTNRSPNVNRTWREVEDLVQFLTDLADEHYSFKRDFYMSTFAHKTTISLKVKGSEYHAEGLDPWEAATNLATNAGHISTAVSKFLNKG